ncbi:MAG TPA: hypothetical protein VMS17_09645 [Gemmataceae bacterium]|nr:hypothetical protein [Gemmataceae bacterium]
MKSVKRLLGAVLFAAVLCATASPAEPPKPKPLTEADVLKLVELAIDDQAVIDRMKKGGLDFQVDDGVIDRLRKAGASDRLLAALQGKDALTVTHPDGVVASGMHDSGAALEITEIKRTSDGCLQVSFRYRNPTDKPIKAYHGSFAIPGDTDITGDVFAPIYYMEPKTKTKHGVFKDDDRKVVASVVLARDLLAPANDVGRTFWVKMTSPDAGADKATFYFQNVAPIEDVPLPPALNK